MDGVSLTDNEESWRLATGDIIDADGTGCVIIKNPELQQALVFDARHAASPKRSEVPLTASLSCASLR
jgi:hypothetical protein